MKKTPLKEESRHRWTTPERKKLIELSRGCRTVNEAARVAYLSGEFSPLKERSLYAQLYDLYLRGQASWLELDKERSEQPLSMSPSLHRAVREMVRVMRTENVSDAMLSLTEGGVKVQLARRTETIDIEM